MYSLNLSFFLFFLTVLSVGHGLSDLQDIIPSPDDVKHMKEHDHAPFEDLSKLTTDELAIKFFQDFDLNGDGRVDVSEQLKKSLLHKYEHEKDPSIFSDSSKVFKEYLERIEHGFIAHDSNNDGYLSYVEYKRAMDSVSKV